MALFLIIVQVLLGLILGLWFGLACSRLMMGMQSMSPVIIWFIGALIVSLIDRCLFHGSVIIGALYLSVTLLMGIGTIVLGFWKGPFLPTELDG